MLLLYSYSRYGYQNTNKHIRLTRNRPSQTGWLWSRLPITATNYVIEVEFKVRPSHPTLFLVVVQVLNLGAVARFLESRAICLGTAWRSGSRRSVQRAVPCLGVSVRPPLTAVHVHASSFSHIHHSTDRFHGLGIFLDTYANSRHPYSFPRVVAMFGDGTAKYDDAGDGEHSQIGACSANVRHTNVATKLRLTFVRKAYLKVRTLVSECWWSDEMLMRVGVGSAAV